MRHVKEVSYDTAPPSLRGSRFQISVAMTCSGFPVNPPAEKTLSRGSVLRFILCSFKTLKTASSNSTLGGSEGKILVKVACMINTRLMI